MRTITVCSRRLQIALITEIPVDSDFVPATMPTNSAPVFKPFIRPPFKTVQERIDFIQGSLPSELTEHITGNVTQEIKEIPVKWLIMYRARGNSFGVRIAERIQVVDVSVVPNIDDPLKHDGRVTTEIEVTEGELSI